jgi:hypothetical protein
MRRPGHGLLETQTTVNGGCCSPNISLIAAATASGVGSSLRAGCASFRPANSCDNPAELWKPTHAASATASSDEDTKAVASCLNLQHLNSTVTIAALLAAYGPGWQALLTAIPARKIWRPVWRSACCCIQAKQLRQAVQVGSKPTACRYPNLAVWLAVTRLTNVLIW